MPEATTSRWLVPTRPPQEGQGRKFATNENLRPVFDVPVTYNSKIKKWINYYQTSGRKWFRVWLERSMHYIPLAQEQLQAHGLPRDLAYIAMIESGFSSSAHSHAGAVGYWQFIAETARRYGLRVDWWVDERHDFDKSTQAAIRYFRDLHRMFGSWYLAAAAYNTGENRIRRLVEKHGTRDFWALAKEGVLSQETIDYVPKMLAAMIIAKAPGLYGFTDLEKVRKETVTTVQVSGGIDLWSLSGESPELFNRLQNLNPSLRKGIVPPDVPKFALKVPPGHSGSVQGRARHVAAQDSR